jgi:hypothetical protein
MRNVKTEPKPAAAKAGVAKQPNPAQLAALIAYARANGRTWKSKLSVDWSYARARVDGEISAELQQVRNEFGPSWLRRFRLRVPNMMTKARRARLQRIVVRLRNISSQANHTGRPWRRYQLVLRVLDALRGLKR